MHKAETPQGHNQTDDPNLTRIDKTSPFQDSGTKSWGQPPLQRREDLHPLVLPVTVLEGEAPIKLVQKLVIKRSEGTVYFESDLLTLIVGSN